MLTMNEYQQLAQRTMSEEMTTEEKTLHALHGIASEVGEIHGIFQKAYQGHAVRDEELMKEVGDLLWFVAELCTARAWQVEDVARHNIDKLKRRYPDGFDPERSRNREE